MKKIILFLSLLFISNICVAAPPARQNTYTSGTEILAQSVTENEDVIYNYLQTGTDTFADGSIVNADVNATANIQSDKLNLTAVAQAFAITSGGSFSNAGSFTQTGTAATFAGVTIANLGTVTTADINGGTLDNSIVGGSTAANGTFTNLTANTTFKLGTTNQGDILYDNGTSIVRLTPGTNGQFFQTNGAAANPEWTDLSVQFKSQTAMTTATTSGAITIAANKIYQVFIEGIKLVSTGSLYIRFNADSANNYDYKVKAWYCDATADDDTESEAGSGILMHNGVVALNGPFKAWFTIDTTQRNSDSAFVIGKSIYLDNAAGSYAVGDFGGVYDTAATITSFQIDVQSGDTFTGNITLYEHTTN